MSLARKAVRGAMWTIGGSMGGRVLSLIGTVIITRFIAPDVVGEVANATILCFTAGALSHFGFSQYIVVRAKQDGREAVWTAAVWSWLFGLIAFVSIGTFGHHFSDVLASPNLGDYLPGMAVALGIRRFASVPDRVLISQMRFRAVTLIRSVGEVAYFATAVSLAAAGWGGEAIVVGNVAQSAAMALGAIAATDRRDWLSPGPVTAARTRDLFRFGSPIGVAGAANIAAKYWDNLLFSRFFGPYTMGLYNLGYNLADIPATQVGEEIGGVLLPSMAQVEPARRPALVARSTALLALLIFPLAIGLGAIAESLIAVALNEQWQGVAPLLTVLSVVSVFRPVSWVIGSYMQVQDRTRTLMALELAKVVVLLGSIWVLARYGALTACFAVGIAFGFHAIVLAAAVIRDDRVPVGPFLAGFLGPLTACLPMVGAVLGVRYGLDAAGVGSDLVSLVLEIVAGAAVYVPAAFLFAGGTARDFLDLLKRALGRGD